MAFAEQRGLLLEAPEGLNFKFWDLGVPPHISDTKRTTRAYH